VIQFQCGEDVAKTRQGLSEDTVTEKLGLFLPKNKREEEEALVLGFGLNSISTQTKVIKLVVF